MTFYHPTEDCLPVFVVITANNSKWHIWRRLLLNAKKGKVVYTLTWKEKCHYLINCLMSIGGSCVVWCCAPVSCIVRFCTGEQESLLLLPQFCFPSIGPFTDIHRTEKAKVALQGYEVCKQVNAAWWPAVHEIARKREEGKNCKVILWWSPVVVMLVGVVVEVVMVMAVVLWLPLARQQCNQNQEVVTMSTGTSWESMKGTKCFNVT